MLSSDTWLSRLPVLSRAAALFSWPGERRRALCTLLAASGVLTLEPSRKTALCLDRGFLRPLRALGFSVTDEKKAALVCASAEKGDDGELIATLQSYADKVESGGLLVVSCGARQRERLSAAFLHIGLFDIQQARVGRSFLTAGTRR